MAKSHLSPELKAVKKKLEEEQLRLEAELHEIIERNANLSDGEKMAEISSYDDHPADLASETFEREKDLAMENNIINLLDKVTAALDKIKDNTYGICDNCEIAITESRLEALPWATYCRDCQDLFEGRRR